MTSTPEEKDLTALTAEVAAAFLANPSNRTIADEIPAVIAKIHAALARVDAATTASGEPANELRVPAVAVDASITPGALISLIDGKPYKTLKRHLTKHGLTPDTYREAFGLPDDYPMVSAAYSQHRRQVANDLKLGRKLGTRLAKTKRSTEDKT